jgi:hypothetical protein
MLDYAWAPPMLAYMCAVLAGVDGAEDEMIVPYLIAQIAGFALYVSGQRYKFKHRNRPR